MDGGVQRSESEKARVVADLTLPEALVIWALRKRHTSNRDTIEEQGSEGQEASYSVKGSRGSLFATFTKVFGHAQVSEAIETFQQLIESLERGARCPLRINAYADEQLSIHEEHFLSVLAAFQQTETERAAMLIQWLINRDHDAAFTRQAHSFANLLRKSGHSLSGRILRSAAKETRISTGAGLAAVERTEDLTLGEAIILQGTRRWVVCLHQEKEPFPVLQAHFAHYGVRDCSESLNAVLRNIAFAADRTVDVRGPACPNLSPDEADLLHAVAGFQRNDSTPAYDALANWLPPAAIRLSAGALSNLADSLLVAGLILPIRERSLTDEPQGHHTRSWRFSGAEVTGRTLH
ncbi:hypothetical protein [Pelagibius sp. Alg239-R121]|uniref:hypothetical protein n=1 Tax=Pelagibius sp. Alg239-R121 TaxID=2993448 RepID=UPI0024A7192E|nr:hypothetical protein [Pelagibius sp. Alg239-R121]